MLSITSIIIALLAAYFTIGFVVAIFSDIGDMIWAWLPILLYLIVGKPLEWLYNKGKSARVACKKSRIPPTPSDILCGMLCTKILQNPTCIEHETWTYRNMVVRVEVRWEGHVVTAYVDDEEYKFSATQREQLVEAFNKALNFKIEIQRSEYRLKQEHRAADLIIQLKK